MISKLDFSLLALIFEHFYLLMKILDREAQFGMDQINWAKNQDLENGEPPPISDHFRLRETSKSGTLPVPGGISKAEARQYPTGNRIKFI